MNTRFQYLLERFTKEFHTTFHQRHRAKKPLDETPIHSHKILFHFFPTNSRLPVYCTFLSRRQSKLRWKLLILSLLTKWFRLMAEIKFMSHNGVPRDNLFCDTCKRNHRSPHNGVGICMPVRCRFMSCWFFMILQTIPKFYYPQFFFSTIHQPTYIRISLKKWYAT